MVFVGVIGVNHKTADLSLREVVARTSWTFSNNPFFPYPNVVLSTCNRMEIYFHADDLAAAHSQLLGFFRKNVQEPFEQSLYSFFGIDCFFHLCKVAAGLDSAILAESEIQRQVRVAYANAKNLPSCMHFMFQKALKVSKEIRSKGQKSSHSLYNALWRLANWQHQNILLVGYSQINRGLISFLLHKGISKITLCTRNPEGVNIEGIRVGDRRLLNEWQKYDLIVCASNGDDYLIRGKGEKRHTIFDLSVPRNVDPHVGATIINIEEVNRFIQEIQSPETALMHESMIWQNVIRLTRIYRTKTQRVLDNEGMGLHL